MIASPKATATQALRLVVYASQERNIHKSAERYTDCRMASWIIGLSSKCNYSLE